MRNILSPHFEGNDLENLIKIIEMMQAPDSFEFGITLLETLNLYDPFIQFLEEYVIKHGGSYGEKTALLNYMFGKHIFCYYVCERYAEHGNCHCGLKFPSRGVNGDIWATNIILPLFCQELHLLEFVWATPAIPSNTKIINVQDIAYSIAHFFYGLSELLCGLPDNVKEMVIGSGEGVLEQNRLPSQLEALHILNGRYIQRNALLHLKKLRLFKFRLNEDILNWQFPPNILKLCIDGRYWEDDIEIILYILEQNPKLQIIEGGLFWGQY